MTTPSPSTVGSTATRMSSRRPAAFAFREMRPSCGLRRSAMSSFASTLRRVVTPGERRFGMRCTSCSTPSTRRRTTSASSWGSKWTSLAPSSAAWRMIEFTRRTSGASETPSSASRSSPSSSSSAPRSNSSSTSAARSQASLARTEALELELDVLRRGNADLDHEARSEPKLVDRLHVRGVCNRDAELVPRDLVRDRPRALQHVGRNRLGGDLLDPDGAQVDERKVVTLGDRPSLVARGRSGCALAWDEQLGRRRLRLLHDRLRQRAGAGTRARAGQTVERNQPGRLEQLGDEVRDAVLGDARARRVLWLDPRRLLTVARPRSTEWLKLFELHL